MARKLEWKKLAPGVRCRLHPSRKHGIKPDKYFVLRYTVNGRRKQEALGWASEGWSLPRAQEELIRLKEASRIGQGPTTLAEKRQQAEERRKVQLASQKAESFRLIPFAEYWVKHYLPHAKRTKKQNSLSKEESHFKKWLAPAFGRLPLVEIKMRQWDALMRTLDKAGLSQRSKEYITGTARRVLRHAKDRGLNVDIPTGRQIGATAPKDNRRLRVITSQEAQAILGAIEARDQNAWRLTRFAFLTGCRLSEAANLIWGHVDLERGELVFADTKNKENRRLPITPPLRKLFLELKRGTDDALIFGKQSGGAYKEAPAAFVNVVASLGLNQGRGPRERLTFHSIRHSVATELAKRLSLRELMDTMGWRSVDMAARYMHTNQDNQQRALAGLENLLTAEQARVIPFSKST